MYYVIASASSSTENGYYFYHGSLSDMASDLLDHCYYCIQNINDEISFVDLKTAFTVLDSVEENSNCKFDSLKKILKKYHEDKVVLDDFKDFSFELDDMEINVFCATDDPIHFMEACFEECPDALDEYVDEDTEKIDFNNNDPEEIGEALEAFSTWM